MIKYIALGLAIAVVLSLVFGLAGCQTRQEDQLYLTVPT